MLIIGNLFYKCDKELKAVETLLELSQKTLVSDNNKIYNKHDENRTK